MGREGVVRSDDRSGGDSARHPVAGPRAEGAEAESMAKGRAWRKTARPEHAASAGSPATQARAATAETRALVRTLATGMALLGLFDAEHRRWSLDEMVVRLGVSRMTAYRMARTLQGTGHLVHDPAIGGYRLGPAMLAGIYLAEGFAQLVDVARPYLESLVKQTGELAAIAVELDGVAVCADLVASARPFVPEIAVGRVIGDTANAHGKMFAAMKPDAERARIARKPHRRLTPSTITDPAALAAELDRIRREGLAFDFEEHDLGTCAVVAPVRNQTGELIATLGVRGADRPLRS